METEWKVVSVVVRTDAPDLLVLRNQKGEIRTVPNKLPVEVPK